MKAPKPKALEVKIEDATFFFKPVGRIGWIEAAQMGKKDVSEQFAELVTKLVSIDGLTDEDGNALTVEQFSALDLDLGFVAKLLKGYYDAIGASLGFSGADTKNAPTSQS